MQRQLSTAQTQMSTGEHQMQAVQPQIPSVQPQMPIVQPQKLYFQPQMPNFQTQMPNFQTQMSNVQSQMPKCNYLNQPFKGQSQTPLYHTFSSNQIQNCMSSENQLASQFTGFSYPQSNLDFQSLTAKSLQEKTAQNLILTASQLQNTAAQILSQGHTAGQGQVKNTSHHQQQYQTSVLPQYYSASQY